MQEQPFLLMLDDATDIKVMKQTTTNIRRNRDRNIIIFYIQNKILGIPKI